MTHYFSFSFFLCYWEPWRRDNFVFLRARNLKSLMLWHIIFLFLFSLLLRGETTSGFCGHAIWKVLCYDALFSLFSVFSFWLRSATESGHKYVLLIVAHTVCVMIFYFVYFFFSFLLRSTTESGHKYVLLIVAHTVCVMIFYFNFLIFSFLLRSTTERGHKYVLLIVAHTACVMTFWVLFVFCAGDSQGLQVSGHASGNRKWEQSLI